MTQSELQELGLPEIFLSIGNATAPINVRASCLPTGEFLQMQPDLARRFPSAANYVPLWMLNSFGVVAFDRQRRAFVRYYIGDAEDEVVGRSYEELCAFLFLELMDSGLWDELDELAPLFRFEHLEALKTFVGQGHSGPAIETGQEFVRTIRGRRQPLRKQ